jgi:EAL domain-containing protein (putative c-di-GMP-specific phosphodiesterase class I)
MPTIDATIAQLDLYHLFQPVCRLPDRQIMGYEALLRSRAFTKTDQLIETAAQDNKLFELDIWSITNAAAAYFAAPSRSPADALLFLNIFPSSMARDDFPTFVRQLMRQFGRFSERMVFEINESAAEGDLWDHERFVQNVGLLRRQGCRIAFDDVGEGATTLKRIVEFSPEFIKIDRFFGKQLSVSKQKQKMIKFLVDYCKDESQLILEGIEEPEDLLQAQHLGVTMGQGFLLAEPEPLPGADGPE